MKRCRILIVGIVVIMSSQVLHADWTEDFESYADTAALNAVWDNSNVSGDDPYLSSYGHLGGGVYQYGQKALGAGGNGKAGLRALGNLPSGRPIVAEAWLNACIYVPSETTLAGTANFYLCSDGVTNSGSCWQSRVSGVVGEKFKVYDADGSSGSGYYEVGTIILSERAFYNVRVEATPDTVNGGTYDVYINDVLVYEDAKYNPIYATEETTYVRFAHSYAGTSYHAPIAVDDVSITSLPYAGTIMIIK